MLSPYMIPKRSFSRKSSTTSQGNSAVLSISAARGAIFSRAIGTHELADLTLLLVQGSRALMLSILEPINGA